jgi:splicing factor 3B subunit 3
VYGNFSSPKAQEIVVSRGKMIELLRPDENGKLQTIASVEMFAVIRSILTFRLTGIILKNLMNLVNTSRVQQRPPCDWK